MLQNNNELFNSIHNNFFPNLFIWREKVGIYNLPGGKQIHRNMEDDD